MAEVVMGVVKFVVRSTAHPALASPLILPAPALRFLPAPVKQAVVVAAVDMAE